MTDVALAGNNEMAYECLVLTSIWVEITNT